MKQFREFVLEGNRDGSIFPKTTKMKNLKFLPALTLAAGVQFVSLAAFAQPDPNNTPKIENPVNRPVGVRNQILDPVAMQQRLAQRAKQQLQIVGITDPAQQDAVLAYTDGEREADAKIREKGQQLQVLLRNKTVTDSQLATLLNEYHVAVEEDKERRTKALETLKQTVDFTKNPRIETYLTLAGLYGDGPALQGAINLGGNQRGGGQRGGAQFGAAQMGAPFGGAQFGAAMGRPANNAGAGAGFNGGGVNAGAAAAPAAVNGALNLNGFAPRNGRNRNRQNNNTPEAPAAALVPAG